MASIKPATFRLRQTILCLALSLLFLETPPLSADVRAREAAEAAGNQGATLVSRGEHLKGIVRLQKAVSLYRRIGDKAREAECIAVIGIAHSELKNFSESIEILEAALGLYREIENIAGQAGMHSLLGNVFRLTGRHQEQAEHWESALSLFRKLGNSEKVFTLWLYWKILASPVDPLIPGQEKIECGSFGPTTVGDQGPGTHSEGWSRSISEI